MTAAKPAGNCLTPDQVERQLRRTHRWRLPHSPDGYQPVRHHIKLMVDIAPPPTRATPSPGAIAAVAASVLLHAVLLGLLARWILPPAGDAARDELLIVIAKPASPQSLQMLPVDIATSLVVDDQWRPFTAPVSRRESLAPLAVPAVADRFEGNPLALLPEAGGDVVVGGDQGAASQGRQDDGAPLHGVHARGRKFVLVLDNTTPMFGHLWEREIREAVAAVSRLQSGQRFAILLLSGERLPPRGLQVVSPLAAEETRHWLETATLVDRGDPQAAIDTSLQLAPDAVYLMGGPGFDQASIDYVRNANQLVEEQRMKLPAIIVHTISLGTSPSTALRRIAMQNGGHFAHLSRQDDDAEK